MATAHRAVQNLPFDTLRQVSPDPCADLEHRSYRRLANAGLTRLGLATPPEKTGTATTSVAGSHNHPPSQA